MAKFAFVDTYAGVKIGIFNLSSVLKQHGHTVDIFLEPLEDNFLQSLKIFNPEFIGFGSFLGQEVDVIETFIKIKNALQGTITILGGPSVLINSDLIYHPSIDFILKGDAENSLPQFIEIFNTTKDFSLISGLVWKDNNQIIENGAGNLIKDFTSFPNSDRNLIYKYKELVSERTKPFILSRGCPYSCTFCGTSTLNQYFRKNKVGTHFRCGSIDRAINEIKHVKKEFGMEWVQFHDATFNANKIFMEEFLKRYKAENLPPFICNVRSEGITEEIVILLKQAGCEKVTMGIQSGSSRIRKELSGRAKQTDENIVDVCRLFKKHKIRVNVDMIFGWPGESISEGLDTINLAHKALPDGLNSNVMIYYPDASITKYAHKNGYLEIFPNVFDVEDLCNPYRSKLKKTPDINNLINFDKLVHYLVKFNLLRNKYIFKFLISVRPNTFYLMAKSFPNLLRDLKFSARNGHDKFKYIYRFFKKGLTWRTSQVRAIEKANLYKQEIMALKENFVKGMRSNDDNKHGVG
jgi:radical SAM superfamily enzyme YgiQ (UPF0313 family)